jgi:hypothetical protein
MGTGTGGNIFNVTIYATPGTNGRQVAQDFADELGDELGVTYRIRHAGAPV